jgi:hypothetical protein
MTARTAGLWVLTIIAARIARPYQPLACVLGCALFLSGPAGIGVVAAGETLHLDGNGLNPPGRLDIDPTFAAGGVGRPHDLPALPIQVLDEHCLHARLGVPVAIASWRGRSGAHDITHIRLEDLFGSRLAAIDYELEAQRGKHPPRHLSSESSSRDTRRHLKGLLDRVDRQTDLDRVLVKRLGPDIAKLAPHVLCSKFKLSAVDCEPHAASFVEPPGPVLLGSQERAGKTARLPGDVTSLLSVD